MPPSPESSTPNSMPKNDSLEKYKFPFMEFICCSILANAIFFMILSVTIGTMFWQFSSAHAFNKEFYDSCQVQNSISLKDLFKLRTEIYDDQLVLKELNHVDLDKIRAPLKIAIEEEIEYKINDLNATIEKCEFQEFYRKTCYTKKIKNFIKNQSQSVKLAFKIYVPCSVILLLAVLAAFCTAKTTTLSDEQNKAFKILALLFGCHFLTHILMIYSMIYDNSYNFKPKEIPSICTKDDPFLTEECYFNGTNCFEMCDLPKMLYENGSLLTIINYIFWQIFLFIVGVVLMVFGEGRATMKDGYEEV